MFLVPLFPSESACFWVLLSPANLALLTPLLRQSRFLPHLTSHHVPLQPHSIVLLHSILLFRFLSSHLCTMLPALQACRKRLDHSLSLPAENRTCFIKANPHVHRVHTVAHVQLDPCSISNISDVRIIFIQHHSVSGSDDLLH